jgi:glycogen(starch) synthase
MRILFWSETFWPVIGGVEVLAVRLLSALRERGHQFAVVTSYGAPGAPPERILGDIPVYRLPFELALAKRDIEQLVRARREVADLKRSFRPNLVHEYHLGRSALFHLETVRARPVPMLATLHQVHRAEFLRPDEVIGTALRRADWVTSCSAVVLSQTTERVPEIAARSSVILNSLEAPALLPEPLPFDRPRLLCLGRVQEQKGFDLALMAFASLRERFPDLRLVVAGDGSERASLERWAVELGIADRVDFLGWVVPQDVPALINAATIVLMPSRHEGLPIVALQAAQMARPVVATPVDGLSEVMVHGESGLLVEPEDSRALAEAIAFLLERPEVARGMGEAARRRAQEVFSWERHVDAYDTLYRRLIGQPACFPSR